MMTLNKNSVNNSQLMCKECETLLVSEVAERQAGFQKTSIQPEFSDEEPVDI
jgi:hypothetical protein